MTVNDYTSTTEEIRSRLVPGADMNDLNELERQELEDFDTWLAAHDAELKAEALTEFEDKYRQAAHTVESTHHIHGVVCLCGFESHRSRSRTEHITQAIDFTFMKATS